MPLVLLTNGGGITEKRRAEKVNKILGEDGLITENEMIMSHTPLRELSHSSNDKFTLVSGMGNIEEVFSSYNYPKFLSVQEFLALHPELCTLSWRHIRSEDQREEIK